MRPPPLSFTYIGIRQEGDWFKIGGTVAPFIRFSALSRANINESRSWAIGFSGSKTGQDTERKIMGELRKHGFWVSPTDVINLLGKGLSETEWFRTEGLTKAMALLLDAQHKLDGFFCSGPTLRYIGSTRTDFQNFESRVSLLNRKFIFQQDGPEAIKRITDQISALERSFKFIRSKCELIALVPEDASGNCSLVGRCASQYADKINEILDALQLIAEHNFWIGGPQSCTRVKLFGLKKTKQLAEDSMGFVLPWARKNDTCLTASICDDMHIKAYERLDSLCPNIEGWDKPLSRETYVDCAVIEELVNLDPKWLQ